MLPVIMQQPAIDDLDEAIDWFSQQTRDRSQEFAAEVRRLSDHIGRFPLAGAAAVAPARQIALRRFRYVLIFIPYDDRVEIISVFHTSRDPAIWRARITP